MFSSLDVPTYTLPSNTMGELVLVALGWLSTCLDHASLPVCWSTA
jgi:hypothetical protein